MAYSKGVNKVILIGNLGDDPDIRYTPQGAAIANLSIATSESWKDKTTGKVQEKTEWHRVMLFGRNAENAQQYLFKGSKVYIEGKLETRKWQDNNGNDRYTTSVIVDPFNGVIQYLSSRDNSGQPPAQQQGAPAQRQQNPPVRQPQQNGYANARQGRNQQPAQGTPPQPDFDDDIPF
ncbi:single-stranded DNA-binding protein [Endozoicomonas sp. Mp262]|uniref:single-stranded DNA-binding protein n=1 Tax=Endozoicomonas sp. Mp262 TaxID=2919499 RepID=UPI0021DA1069